MSNEPNRTTTRRLAVLLVPFSVILLLAAAPEDSEAPEDLLRRGNEAVHRGDLKTAEQLYAQAARRHSDPGLVAFNRAVVDGLEGDPRGAEANFLRSLDDRAAPPPRRARALYNRGICLLKGGGSVATLRSAVACFEQALELLAADDPLAADARHNLDLAKLLWNKERAKSKSPQRPNELPPDVPEPLPPESRADPAAGDPGGADSTGGSAARRPQVLPGGRGKHTQAHETPQRLPGAGSLPVILDPDRPDNLSADEARALLKAATVRIDKDRRSIARITAGPERPHVRDW